jgi:hypothetical protein
MNSDESILGLLLRAHAQVAEQKHGERYMHENIATSMDYETAQAHIESAIRSVVVAERTQARFIATKEAEKQVEAIRSKG